METVQRQSIMEAEEQEWQQYDGMKQQQKLIVEVKEHVMLEEDHQQPHFDSDNSIDNMLSTVFGDEQLRSLNVFTQSQLDRQPQQQSIIHDDQQQQEENEKNLTRNLPKQKSCTPTLAPHECTVCGKRFHIHSKLKMHAIIHTTPSLKPHACNICGKCFRYPNYLSIHQRLHDTDSRPYKCKYCTEHFHSLHKRRLHMTSEHLEATTYLCTMCPSVLASACLLRDHIKRHRGQRDYACNECEKRFYSRRQLQDHQDGVHANLRPHKCELCEMRFQRKSHYVQHVKLHASVKTYTCTLCSKAFAQKAGLYMHMRTHKRHQQ